ncbi:ABC transporter permease [Streptomyces sp. NPDC050263]|uniref:ABC transporter permease n=1 Tax=Streptomyces sp. NPDC050263 TaxID=3155037 RepID=UPI0034194EF2
MNFVKRAGLSLWSRKGKTLLTLCTFLVISVMVLAGVLIRDATAQARREAVRSVGAEVNLAMDLRDVSAGGGFVAPRIDVTVVDRLGASPLVQKYSYSTFDRGVVKGGVELVAEGVDVSAAGMGPDGTATLGVLDSALLPAFRSGAFKLLSGRHLTAADKDERLLLIEERLARKNGLGPGDRITLGANEGKATADFTVAGVYQDPRPGSEPDPEYGINPANMLYASVGGFTALNSTGTGPQQVGQATFLLEDADDLERFKAEAGRIAGSALDGFALDANDKAIRQMTGPLDSITSTATLAMWLIGLAGTVVLALLVDLAVKQRRKEYGVLLAMGEKTWKLIAQQALEIVAVAVLAVGLSSLFTEGLTQSVGQSLLGREAADARHELDSWQPPAKGSTGLADGSDPDDRPVENADPVDRITVRLEPAALAAVGAVGLGIGLLATAVPAAFLLRLNPRTILTKGK